MAEEADAGSEAARWEHFPHEADVGVRGRGASPAEAFQQAALALAAVTADPARVRACERVDVRCSAPDLELLLFDWLNALAREAETRGLLFARFEVRIGTGPALEGAAWGEPVDAARHEPGPGVKGATFSLLKVARGPDGRWTAQCVVDV